MGDNVIKSRYKKRCTQLVVGDCGTELSSSRGDLTTRNINIIMVMQHGSHY